MLGAVLRSDGRKYSDIFKAGAFWGLIFGVLGFIISLFMGAENPLIRGFLTFVSAFFSIEITFLLGAFIYDLSNEFIDN